MKITRHACKRFIERVIGSDVDDARSIKLARNILNDNSCHIDVGVNCDLPIIGFSGCYIRVRDNTVVTVINKGKKK